MEEATKVAEAPVVKPEATVDEPLIDNRRSQIENLVITENDTIPETPKSEVPVEPKPEAKEENDLDPVDRIKKSVQKRIDKVVAQKKSAEEELAEARAEIERLKAKVEAPEAPKPTQDDTPPTPEQVEAYIAKMSEEGNHKEVAAATRYLIKLEKELAMKEIEARQNETQTKAEAIKQKQLNDWANLSRDYVAYDENGAVDLKSDLNLSNQNGLLYKTALSLYNDKELHRDFYNDPDVIQGFRRAVSDAYREIHQQGLITPKGNTVVPRSPREVLADPSADTIEEPTQTTPNSLSDAEKVREEIKARSKNRFKR